MKRFLLKWCVVLAGLVFAFAQMFGEFPDGRLHLYFLDVGQGDGYLMVTPQGRRILVDSGSGSAVVPPLRRTLGWLRDDIDLLILTHFDRDHAEGALSVLQSFVVKRLLITGVEQGTELESMILRAAGAQNIPIMIGNDDTDFWLDDGIFMDIMWPAESPAGKRVKKANETGIVFRLMVGVDVSSPSQRCVFLGMADTGFPTEDALMKNGADLDCDILKVGHHGSKYSSGLEFLKAVSPEVSVISVGARNRYGHPTEEALERIGAAGSRILRTDTMGTIEMVVNPESGEVVEMRLEK